MKILYLISSMGLCSSEKQLLDISIELVRHGHNNTLISILEKDLYMISFFNAYSVFKYIVVLFGSCSVYVPYKLIF